MNERVAEQSREHHEHGYSLIELMVAMLISTLVVGGVMVMLTAIGDVHRDSQQLIDAQQAARISLEQVQRDLQVAGVGLAWLVPPLPLVVPQADGGVIIRHCQSGITTVLDADMGNANDPMTVDDVTGFEVGQSIGVYDASGAMDLVTVTGIDAGNSRIQHSGASKAYTVADGTAVARIETIQYSVDAQDRLTRSIDGAAAQPIAGNVVSLTITYWDSGNPPAVFVPVSNAEMMMIQTVQVDLTIQTEDPRLNTVTFRQVTLTTQVTPRAIVLS